MTIFALDIETYKFDQKEGAYKPILNAQEFSLGCIKSEKGQKWFFDSPNTMYDWIKETIKKEAKRNSKCYFYGHNTEYDWYGIAKNHLIEEGTKNISFTPFITIIDDRGYILDNMAFYRMSLADVGEIVNLPKLEMPTKVKMIGELTQYLERDVDITLKAILKLKEDLKALGFKPKKLLTAGQLAMTSFLTFSRRNGTYKGFMEYDEKARQYRVVKSNYAKIVRQAFRGGNNTAFSIGTFNNATLLDKNSMYGRAMTEMVFPDLKSEMFFNDIQVEVLLKYIGTFIGVAQCTVVAPNITRGYLPIRYSGYQIRPTNIKLRGTWTFLELKKALKLGYKIISVDWAVTWKKSKYNPLKPFIRELYTLKQKEDGKYKQVIKLLMNNLFGKFAQLRTNKDFKIVQRAEITSLLEQGYEVSCKMEDKYVMTKVLDYYEPSYVNPIISTYITAFAADDLYDTYNEIDLRDLLYCDTDSIMLLNYEKYKHLFDLGDGLGQWKIEAKGKCKILGEKRYYIDKKAKISGLAKSQVNNDIIDKEEDVLTQRMIGMQDALNRGIFESVGTFTERPIEMKPHCKASLILPDFIDETKLNIMQDYQ